MPAFQSEEKQQWPGAERLSWVSHSAPSVLPGRNGQFQEERPADWRTLPRQDAHPGEGGSDSTEGRADSDF